MVENQEAPVEDVIEAVNAVSDDIVFSDMLTENVSEVLSEALYHADGSPLSPDNQLNSEYTSKVTAIIVSQAIQSLEDIEREDIELENVE